MSKEVKMLFGLDIGAIERMQKIHDDHERVKKRYAKRPVGRAQRLILVRLAAIYAAQKIRSQIDHSRFQGGWTHVRTGRFTRLESLQGLLRRGLATACCDGHDGTDMVKITEDGIKFLHSINLRVTP